MILGPAVYFWWQGKDDEKENFVCARAENYKNFLIWELPHS